MHVSQVKIYVYMMYSRSTVFKSFPCDKEADWKALVAWRVRADALCAHQTLDPNAGDVPDVHEPR